MLKINGLIAWMSWTNWIGMIFTEPTSIVPFQTFPQGYLHKPIPSQNRSI